VVKIATRDFNKELGSYIDKKRTRQRGSGGLVFKIPFKTTKRDEVVPDMGPTEVHVEYKKPSRLSRLFTFRRKLIKEAERSEDLSPQDMAKLRAMEDDVEDTEEEIVEKEEEIKEIREEEEELVEKRENMLKKFFGSINIFKRKRMETVEVDAEYQEEPALDQDVVDVLKVTHKWIDQLSPAKKRSFKASNDFKKYKGVLEKYGLVKKK